MTQDHTIVFVHAHPDDEASQTSGSMARAAADGDRVVVVFCTNGDHGEPAADLAPDQTVADYRRGEAEASARVLGTQRVAWLGYGDSGMTGWDQNDDPGCFHQADLDEAAGRLAEILVAERPDVVVGYDWHGGYGHPDHIKVHHVTHRAVEMLTLRTGLTPRVLEQTGNRDVMRAQIEAAVAAGMTGLGDFHPDNPMDDGNPFGTPEAELHWKVDVSAFLDAKRASMESHRSQTSDIGGMLAMPPEVFAMAFGTEYYIEPGRAPGMVTGWPFA